MRCALFQSAWFMRRLCTVDGAVFLAGQPHIATALSGVGYCLNPISYAVHETAYTYPILIVRQIFWLSEQCGLHILLWNFSCACRWRNTDALVRKVMMLPPELSGRSLMNNCNITNVKFSCSTAQDAGEQQESHRVSAFHA